MAMTQCENGHFYDTDVNPTCPYCGRQQPIIDFSAPGGAQDPRGGFNGPTGAPADNRTQAPQGGYTGPSGMNSAGGDGRTMPPSGWGPSAASSGDGRTMPPSGWGPSASASGDGKTMPPSDWKKSAPKPDEGKTVPIMHQDVFDPDVGWLVCIAGPDKGRSFALKAKGNTVGRSSAKHQFDVSLAKDLSISRDALVASIGYDVKRNTFVLISGETSILYLNGEVAGSRSALHAFDAIEIGNSDTVLLFVPLCGPRFSWNDGLKEGGNG